MFFYPINIWAILVSAVISMALGFIWYSSKLFGTTWMKLSGISPTRMKETNKHMVRLYTGSFVASLVMIYVLAELINLTLVTSIVEGVTLAAMVWLGFVAASMVNTVFFENKSWILFAINSGYYLASLIIAGIILSVWF